MYMSEVLESSVQKRRSQYGVNVHPPVCPPARIGPSAHPSIPPGWGGENRLLREEKPTPTLYHVHFENGGFPRTLRHPWGRAETHALSIWKPGSTAFVVANGFGFG